MSLLRTAILLAMLGLAGAIAAGFLGFVHPAFDLFSNFRLHFSVALLVLAALWSFRCSKAPSIVFALIGFGGLFACAPGLPITSYANTPAGGERVYRLFAMNLLWRNPTPGKVLEAIGAADPDILYLTEMSWHLRQLNESLREDYPYAFRCAEWKTVGGSVILSRLPIRKGKDFCGDYASLGLTTIVIEGKEISAGVVHLRWPWPASGPRQIDALVPRLERLRDDALIAGDFNSVTWSHGVTRFAAAGGLEIARGIGATWGPALVASNLVDEVPADRKLSAERVARVLQWPAKLGLPIDNAMSKGVVRIVSARTLPPAGSDHLPLLIEFVVRD